VWVRGQGEVIAKAIWFQRYFYFDIKVSWSGMIEAEKEDLATWLKERVEKLAERRRIETQEYEARKAKYSKEHYLIEEKMGMQAYYRSRLACRADCGEQNPKLYCSKFKIARKSTLLSVWFNTDTTSACQLEDWNILLLTWATVSQNLLWNGRTHSQQVSIIFLKCQ